MWDNVNEATANQNVRDAAKAILRGKLVALNACIIIIFFYIAILTRASNTILSIRSYGRHLYLALDDKKENTAFDFPH